MQERTSVRTPRANIMAPKAIQQNKTWYDQVNDAIAVAIPYAKPIVHWGFIPAIIILGATTTEPRPTLAQLLSPM